MSKELHIGVSGPCLPRLFAVDLGVDSEFLPLGLGGTPVNHLVRALLDSGYRVTLATLDISHINNTPTIFEGNRFTLTIGPYRPSKRARNWFKQERKGITHGFMMSKPDVISAHWSYEFALGSISTGIPTMITVHDVPRKIFQMQPSYYRIVRWLMHRQAVSKASRLAFNSTYTKKCVGYSEKDFGIILPNALPDNYFTFINRKPLNPKFPSYISINNGFSRCKNVSTLLKSFKRVLRVVPDAKLKLLGQDFELGGKAMAWAHTNDLADGVDFVGPVHYQEVLNYLKDADILVHPSLEESFGYTLIEAASVGTPAIGGQNSGAVPWVLAEGEGGLLVDVTDADSLASTMINLASSIEEWEILRTKSFDLAKERFSASKVANSYVQALQEISS